MKLRIVLVLGALVLAVAGVVVVLTPRPPFAFMDKFQWSDEGPDGSGRRYRLKGRWSEVNEAAARELEARGLHQDDLIWTHRERLATDGTLRSLPGVIATEFRKPPATFGTPALISLTLDLQIAQSNEKDPIVEIILTVDSSAEKPTLISRFLKWLLH